MRYLLLKDIDLLLWNLDKAVWHTYWITDAKPSVMQFYIYTHEPAIMPIRPARPAPPNLLCRLGGSAPPPKKGYPWSAGGHRPACRPGYRPNGGRWPTRPFGTTIGGGLAGPGLNRCCASRSDSGLVPDTGRSGSGSGSCSGSSSPSDTTFSGDSVDRSLAAAVSSSSASSRETSLLGSAGSARGAASGRSSASMLKESGARPATRVNAEPGPPEPGGGAGPSCRGGEAMAPPAAGSRAAAVTERGDHGHGSHGHGGHGTDTVTARSVRAAARPEPTPSLPVVAYCRDRRASCLVCSDGCSDGDAAPAGRAGPVCRSVGPGRRGQVAARCTVPATVGRHWCRPRRPPLGAGAAEQRGGATGRRPPITAPGTSGLARRQWLVIAMSLDEILHGDHWIKEKNLSK